MKSHLPRVLFLTALGAGACAPDKVVIGEKAWEGEKLEIWTTEDVTVCGGSFEALDRHASLVAEYAEQRDISIRTKPYRYYWAAQEELNEVCRGSAGCFSPLNDAVYTTVFHPHEIVHAEFASGHSKFIDEGLATMLGGSRFEFIESQPSVPSIVDQTAGTRLAGEHYTIAAKFARAAEALYPDEYLVPFSRSAKSDDFDALSAKVGEHLDVDAILELHESASECGMDSVRLALSECTMDPIPFQGTTWRTTGRVDCASEDAIGPNGFNEISVIRPFEIEEDGKYTIRSESDAVVQFVACGNRFCESGFRSPFLPNYPGNSLFIVPNRDDPYELQAGRYWFRMIRTLDGDFVDGAYDVSVTPGWPPEYE